MIFFIQSLLIPFVFADNYAQIQAYSDANCQSLIIATSIDLSSSIGAVSCSNMTSGCISAGNSSGLTISFASSSTKSLMISCSSTAPDITSLGRGFSGKYVDVIESQNSDCSNPMLVAMIGSGVCISTESKSTNFVVNSDGSITENQFQSSLTCGGTSSSQTLSGSSLSTCLNEGGTYIKFSIGAAKSSFEPPSLFSILLISVAAILMSI